MSTNYQPQPQPQPYTTPMNPGPVPPAAQAPRKPRKWLAWVFVVAAFLFGLAIPTGGGSGSSSEATPVTESDEYKALAAERDELAAQVEAQGEPAAEAPAEEAPAEPEGWTTGDYIMGTNIEPGRYSMTVTDMGYVTQMDGSDFLVQELGEAGETMVVDFADVPGSIVEFSGVTDITKIG